MSFSHPIDVIDNKAKQKDENLQPGFGAVGLLWLRTNSVLFISLHEGGCLSNQHGCLFVSRLDEPNIGHGYAQCELEVVLANQLVVGGSALACFER